MVTEIIVINPGKLTKKTGKWWGTNSYDRGNLFPMILMILRG